MSLCLPFVPSFWFWFFSVFLSCSQADPWTWTLRQWTSCRIVGKRVFATPPVPAGPPTFWVSAPLACDPHPLLMRVYFFLIVTVKACSALREVRISVGCAQWFPSKEDKMGRRRGENDCAVENPDKHRWATWPRSASTVTRHPYRTCPWQAVMRMAVSFRSLSPVNL